MAKYYASRGMLLLPLPLSGVTDASLVLLVQPRTYLSRTHGVMPTYRAILPLLRMVLVLLLQ